MFGFPGYEGRTFEARYRAYPPAFLDRPSLEEGDKVILPPSALDRLVSLHIEYPMLFRVENKASGRSTHCGVLEFVAEEGRVYLPFWMMQNLLLTDGDLIDFKNTSLPKGSYVKLQPVTSDFLDITNPKAVLEKSLRNYTCLTTGDNIVLNYNCRRYEIEIKETRPGPAISVIETDCNVDFEAPKDYVPPVAPSQPAQSTSNADPNAMEEDETEEEEEENSNSDSFLAFSGTGQRLDGKSVTVSGDPVRVPLYSGLTRYPPEDKPEPASKKSEKTSGKNGKLVMSSGNRLLDKLQKDGKVNSALNAQEGGPSSGGPSSSSGQQDSIKKKKEDEDDNTGGSSGFKAFSGKGFSLK
eukprot:g585.t1